MLYTFNMKLFLIKLKYPFLFFLIILLSSCSILDNENDKKSIKLSEPNIKKNNCPETKIPSKTAKYISGKKYILNIKKIEMACRIIEVNELNSFNIVIQYKAKLELKTSNKIKSKDLKLPSIYIAIVDIESETVLAKMKSNINVRDREDNLLVNKKKFRFKYESNENLFIYFGLQ